MTHVTKRGLLALGLGIVLLVGVALTGSGNETARDRADRRPHGRRPILIGIALAVLGLFRRS